MTAWKVKLIAACVLAVLAVFWILQNGAPVQAKLLFVTVTMPLSALLAIALLAGGVAGIVVSLSFSGKWKKRPEPST